MSDNYFVSLALWMFVPKMAAGFVQNLYYKFRYSANSPSIPVQGQKKYIRDYKRIFSLIILLYLLYTVVEVERSTPYNYYQILGVNQQSLNPRLLKSNFRRLSLQFHPDKNPTEEAHGIFITLRQAFETLNDPIKRYAYDRLGTSYLRCQKCLTVRDYVVGTIPSLIGTYAGTGLVLFLLNVLGQGQFGRYWRFVAWATMGSVELTLLFAPQNSLLHHLFSIVLPHRTVAEQISILHQIVVSIFIGLSQIGPVLFEEAEDDIHKPLSRLYNLNDVAAREANLAFRSAFEPFQDEVSNRELRKRMGKLAIDSRLFQDPDYTKMYSSVHERVVSKRRSPS
ncbi:DnaJ-domain-containing protein [Basidiobolus meristosporus CBS 931.73]|uniref:DnaJ-domain-containing protein n=1 Tax=Basidiobolus meristosporus CBS 931.73 TaxID=1314790 RepID=A0A1Y1XRZ3_9FUNG|nr:DnaJ-domain-containing protein [Basidiobolus meristosporus CBS 931.73]|eukprot:ORX88532.1 DnaJ-domain-containing protein [Basidiobolus meristosporus CBS 931.73]